MSGSSPWTRPSAPECGDTLDALAGDKLDLGWGSSSNTVPGSLSTGSPAGRTTPHGDGSMYSQANVRAGKCAAAPYPSVAVRERGLKRYCEKRMGPLLEVQQRDMFPGPTELLLIGCLIELILTQRFKSNILTPRTNLQTSCNQVFVLQPGVRQSHSVISATALFKSRKFYSGSSNGLARHSP